MPSSTGMDVGGDGGEVAEEEDENWDGKPKIEYHVSDDDEDDGDDDA
jgi:hypothetical protein